MTDNQCLMIATAILALRGNEERDNVRDAINIAEVFGIEPSEHTEKELGIVNPFSRSGDEDVPRDDLSLLPGRRAAV